MLVTSLSNRSTSLIHTSLCLALCLTSSCDKQEKSVTPQATTQSPKADTAKESEHTPASSELPNTSKICHFNKIQIPKREAHLMKLARIQHFSCDVKITQNLVNKQVMEDVQFILERYQKGKCVSRECFTHAKFPHHEGPEPYTSQLSFAWHMETQKLVGVHDTGFFDRSGYVSLPGFHPSSPTTWSFFKTSKPENRTGEFAYKFRLYPIIGIRGAKDNSTKVQLGDQTIILQEDRFDHIQALKNGFYSADFFKDSADAVIVYLWFGTGIPPIEYGAKVSR